MDSNSQEVVQADSDSQQEEMQVDSDSRQEAVQVDSESQGDKTDIALIMPQLTTCIKVIRTNNLKMIDMLHNHVGEYIQAEEIDSDYKDHIPVNNNNLVIDALHSDMIDNLHEAVKLMLAAGFERECCDAYSKCRRECLEQCLSYLRSLQPKLKNEDVVKKGTKFIEHEIREWTKSSNVVVRFLFPNERRLCECVFLGFPATADLAFTEVCRTFMVCLLDFPNKFAVEVSSSKKLEVLPRIPKVFKVLHDLIPEFESLIPEPSGDSIRNEAINTWKTLGKATKNILKRLEDWICHEKDMAYFSGGLYPKITWDVMNCLGDICEAWSTLGLEKVFEEHPMVADEEGTSSSSFSIQFTRIIELLNSHLEIEYKNYTDPAEGYVFMMNSQRCIHQKAAERQRRMSTIFQDGVIGEIEAKVKQNLEDYRRCSWDKVIGLLKEGGNEPEAVESMKENLKLFNVQFKQICWVQSTWFVIDAQLRKEIRESIEKILLPRYGVFIGKLQNILGSHANDYIEYSMLDIDALLNDLFRG